MQVKQLGAEIIYKNAKERQENGGRINYYLT